MSALRERLDVAAALLASARDLLDERPRPDHVPHSLAARGWTPFLESLDDSELDNAERHGFELELPSRAPPSLARFVAGVRDACCMPLLATGSAPITNERHRSPRKHAQVEAFAAVIQPLAQHAARIVDVGSGHGHLTRDLAALVDKPVLGLEQNPVLAARAAALTAGDGPRFEVTDVLAQRLTLAHGDLVVGLHACGALGDEMVRATGTAAFPTSMALVACCLQKQPSPVRRSLCTALALPKMVLGLSNLSPGDVGVEASRVENLAARERRLALHRLLVACVPGCDDLELGAEIDGLNRRAAHQPLVALVARSFAARGFRTPSDAAVEDAARWATQEHARLRRLVFPRSLLARLLEVFVLLDRAVFLESKGLAVKVGVLFPHVVSARNLAIVASRTA